MTHTLLFKVRLMFLSWPSGDLSSVTNLHLLHLSSTSVLCLCFSDYCHLTLDPHSAHPRLRLSEDKRTVDLQDSPQSLEDQDRFTDCRQVLSSSGLRGRCYWEVQWRGWGVDIAVSYRGIRRRGDNSRFGENDQSWRLWIIQGQCSFRHNKKTLYETSSRTFSSDLQGLFSGLVGVLLDSEAGALSFFKVDSDGKLSHIYTFSDSFTEPLFPGFGLRGWWGSSVSLVKV